MRLLILLLIFLTTNISAQDIPLDKIKLPPGFTISLYAYPVPSARSLTLGDNGIVYVGTSGTAVYAVLPTLSTQNTHEVVTVADNLDQPNGVSFHAGDLYVAEKSRILKFANIEQQLHKERTYIVIYSKLPKKDHHGLRYLGIGPDNYLYVGVGAPCNVCIKKNPKFGSIMKMDMAGNHAEIIAHGVRNTVGFDWHPISKQLWFTDNGRDYLGDNLPPDELNTLTKEGQHFGFPFCYGKNVPDLDFDPKAHCEAFTPTVFDLQPHGAHLGLRFYTGNLFPPEYKGNILIASHGSWNSSKKVGYDIVQLILKNNEVIESRIFASGWLQGEEAWGRPVDLLIMNDGTMLISDDEAGAIYQINYKK